MKLNIFKFIITTIVATTAIFMTSCSGSRALTGDVQGISAHLEANVKAFNLDEGCNGNIKMKRGEAIQISLTKFGIEGVRIIMTPEEILLVNKLTKTYLRTSFKEADKAMGGEGLLTFRNVEAYFWNDNGQHVSYANLPVGGFVPLELKTSYSKHVRAGHYELPQQIKVVLSGADGAIEPGQARLKLSKVQVANNWQPNSEIPSNYKNLNFISLIKKLMKK